MQLITFNKGNAYEPVKNKTANTADDPNNYNSGLRHLLCSVMNGDGLSKKKVFRNRIRSRVGHFGRSGNDAYALSQQCRPRRSDTLFFFKKQKLGKLTHLYGVDDEFLEFMKSCF